MDVEIGDARLLLEQELARGETQKFDILVLDAFAGDAIPVHLLTREAFEMYWQHLDPIDGVIAVHTSSRHINLFPALRGLSGYFQAESVVVINNGEDPLKTGFWILLSRYPGALNIPGLPPAGEMQITPRLWTDDYSDIVRLIQR